jgi:hypothetical protein
MPGRPAFAALAIVCGLWLCWAGGALAQSPAPSGQDVARSVIAGDLRPLLDPASASRFGVVEIATKAMTPTDCSWSGSSASRATSYARRREP